MSEKSLKRYLKESYGSAGRFELIRKSFELPNPLRSSVIVDLGSSASNAVKKLNQLGARAIGIDFQYGDLHGLADSVERPFIDPDRWNFNIARHIPPSLRGMDSGTFEPEPKGIFARIKSSRKDFNDYGPGFNYLRRSERVYREFLEDFGSVHKDGRYVAALGEELPLVSGSVDLLYSMAAVSIFTIRDRQAFMQVMSESLRVARDIQISPWYFEANEVWSNPMLETAKSFLKRLDKQKIQYHMKLEREIGGYRLRILQV